MVCCQPSWAGNAHVGDGMLAIRTATGDNTCLTPHIVSRCAGAILYKETLTQSSSDGVPFVDCLARQGILPGIKVDEVVMPYLTRQCK